jgi:3-hydroxyisobutyrate dehydrogenase-like beta-hydroxyacid dehydrogenase
MKLGFVGLGRMGRVIAQRLVAAGHDLVVYNRTADKGAELAQAGARVASTIAQACQDREVVISMLADDVALDDVVLGAGGVRVSLPADAIHLAMGTHGVEAIRRAAAAHAAARQILVAAPVLGRPDVAAAGQLGIIAAGPAAALARCEGLFQTIGRRVFAAGAAPEGAAAIKLANSFVLGCAIAAMGEAFALARRHEVVPQVLFDVLTEGLFSAPAYKIYGKIIAEEDYDRVGFTTLLGLKDVNLALAAADAARVPLPSANVVRDRLLGAIAHGDGERDWASIAREEARACGLE